MTCKECIHEKVCDALIKSGCPYLDKEIPAEAFCLEFRNTADVVPKSEVEQANKELDNLAEELSDLIVEKDHLFDEVVRLRKALDEYEETSGLKQAKAEVAREIFEEIEKLSYYAPTPYDDEINVVDYEDIAELKKRYTEGKK